MQDLFLSSKVNYIHDMNACFNHIENYLYGTIIKITSDTPSSCFHSNDLNKVFAYLISIPYLSKQSQLVMVVHIDFI
jgi:GTP:adenosylcobinamide-phosphate guanylyltransferase